MVKNIKLSNFRNFKKKEFKFSDKITVIVGPNASGKTNILESLFLISTGKSFHARIEEEMIAYNAEIARVVAESRSTNQESSKKIQDSRFQIQDSKLEVVLTRGQIEIGEDRYERAPRKKLLVNGISRRLIDFAGNLKVVLFGPRDLDLVTQSPSLRRKFLDNVLSQVDREYRRASLSYEKGLHQRNRLLLRIREEGLSRSQLLFWDKLLIKNGDYINQRRREFIEFVNSGNFKFQISNFKLEYDSSLISENRLEQYAREEVYAATTLVGPHRDDFLFKQKYQGTKELKNSRDLARYGSRGEQRMSVLWLKLSELAFIEQKSGEKPSLLLDDIFSELDHEHREIVMDACKNQQTIITTADPHYVEGFKKVERVELKG